MRDSHRISVSGQVDAAVCEGERVHQKASASRSETKSSRDHRLSFALVMILTVNAQGFQRAIF